MDIGETFLVSVIFYSYGTSQNGNVAILNFNLNVRHSFKIDIEV
jgi:hypothetical protein